MLLIGQAYYNLYQIRNYCSVRQTLKRKRVHSVAKPSKGTINSHDSLGLWTRTPPPPPPPRTPPPRPPRDPPPPDPGPPPPDPPPDPPRPPR